MLRVNKFKSKTSFAQPFNKITQSVIVFFSKIVYYSFKNFRLQNTISDISIQFEQIYLWKLLFPHHHIYLVVKPFWNDFLFDIRGEIICMHYALVVDAIKYCWRYHIWRTHMVEIKPIRFNVKWYIQNIFTRIITELWLRINRWFIFYLKILKLRY